MGWTEQQDSALKVALEQGCSFTQAAAVVNDLFKTGYSRNAAIGRGNRLGLKSKCKKWEGERKPRVRKGEATAIGIVERTQRRDHQFACEPLTGLRIADVVPRNISLQELTDETCKWPYGDTPPFVYCGCEAFDGGPYCEPHAALSAKPMQGVNFNQSEAQRAAHRKSRMPTIASLARNMDAA